MYMTSAESPCNGVCRIDEPSGWCIGCGRSLAEIAQWPTATNAQRSLIVVQLSDRLIELTHRRRSEERRVGKEGVRTCRYRWCPHHSQINSRWSNISSTTHLT